MLLTADGAIDVLAEVAWRTEAPAFDAVYGTVYRAAKDPRFLVGYSRELARDELTARWGARSASLDTAPPVPPGRSLWPWMLLPLAGLAYIAMMVGYVRALRSGRVVVFWVPPR